MEGTVLDSVAEEEYKNVINKELRNKQILPEEKGVDKEDLANEIRCRIGCIWPLVTCFHELYLPTKFQTFCRSQWF